MEDQIENNVTYNAWNITKPVEFTENKYILWKAYTLKLCLKEIFEKCRAIVGHFKKSTKEYEKFKEIQFKLKLKQHKLIQDVYIDLNSKIFIFKY